MKKFAIVAASVSLIGACGGGGGGDTASAGTTTPPPQTAATVDVSDGLSRLLFTDRTSADLASNDGYLGSARLIVKADQSYPFAVDGRATDTVSTRVLQFQELSADGRLFRQQFWKLHFDAARKPIGVAMGDENGSYGACLAVTSVPALPGASSGSGQYLAGVRGSYTEGFKSGSYGHWCAPATGSSGDVAWAMQPGTPEPYLCLTLPGVYGTPTVQVCAAGEALFIRRLAADGTSRIDYRSAGANRPVFPAPGAVNPRDYWYGKVWRPLDGYVYQTYEQVKFPTQQDCRDQTVIDWRSTYSATNIAWSCSHVISH